MKDINTNIDESCKVILTDDDPDDRQFITDALEGNLFNGALIHANNGLALIETLQEGKENPCYHFPDLIVLDLNMPYLDGYQVLRTLNADPELRNIPRVVLTSSLKEADAIACNQLGCLKFYRKPMSLSGYDVIAKDLILLLKQNKSTC